MLHGFGTKLKAKSQTEVAKVQGPLKAKNTDRGAVSLDPPLLTRVPDWAPKNRAPNTLGTSSRAAGEKSELVSSFFAPPKFQTTWLSAHRTDREGQNETESDRRRPAYLPVGGRWSWVEDLLSRPTHQIQTV